MLSPTSIDKTHTGRALPSTNSDAILTARMHDFDTRTTCVLLGRGGANRPRQRVQMDDRAAGRAFSPDLAGCVAGSWGSLGDEGGDVVVGPRSAGISDEVEAASDDARAVLGARASDMLDFGEIGLNCELVVSPCVTSGGPDEGSHLAEVQRGEDLLARWPRSR